MTAHTLALVLIRVFAISFLAETITSLISQIPMLRIMAFDGNEGASDYGHAMIWTISILVLCKLLISIGLFIYSRRIASRIAGRDDEKLESHPELAPILTHVGIVLIGLSALVYNLPVFLGTSIQWFQAQASQPDMMASQLNGGMARTTSLIIIAMFLVLRGKTVTRWLIRLSK